MNERQIRSIPPRTMSKVLRERGVSVLLGGTSLRIRGLGTGIGRPLQPTRAPQEYPFDMSRHVWKKPGKTFVLRENRVTCQVEQFEDYDGQGDLGLILQYSGIELTGTPFKKSTHDHGPDSCVFYASVGYKKGRAFLILGTFGDIFESQVVPKTKDVNPFFREEIYFPQLSLYDPTSMMPSYKNGLIIVSYKAR